MFNSKTKSGETITGGNGTTIIGAGTIINGDITSNGDIRIDGTIIGNLSSKAKVLIGQDGVVEGDINGQQADIMGKVTGMLNGTGFAPSAHTHRCRSPEAGPPRRNSKGPGGQQMRHRCLVCVQAEAVSTG